MDVHAPHEPVHSWRDFFTHIVIVTIGLFIALMLEALVEHVHHVHLLHAAEGNLGREIRSNRALLEKDRAELHVSEEVLANNLKVLEALKAHQPTNLQLNYHWYWSDMQNSAWSTARDTGAIALMSYDQAQDYAAIYGQQDYVNAASTQFIREIYTSAAPTQGGRKLSELNAEQLDRMIAATDQGLADLQMLDDLSSSLQRIYEHTEHEL